jgi:hypothetical protein
MLRNRETVLKNIAGAPGLRYRRSRHVSWKLYFTISRGEKRGRRGSSAGIFKRPPRAMLVAFVIPVAYNLWNTVFVKM